MTTAKRPNEVFRRISEAYRVLAERRARGLTFVSDWNGSHPYVERFVGALADRPLVELGELTRYAFPQEDAELHQEINRFHIRADGGGLRPSVLLIGGGATSMLAVVVQMLRATGRTRAHVLAPLHYTLTALLDREGIESVLLTPKQAFEADFDLELPAGSDHVLILSDPVWQVGRPVPVAVIESIRQWQERTGSLVIVDGTFQYLGWDYRSEASAKLHPELTVRLVCPTKALSLNAFRFSYLIMPKSLYLECATAHDLYHGTSSLADHLFARAAVRALTDAAHTPLLEDARTSFARLRGSARVAEVVEPTCGYFAFVRPDLDLNKIAAMGPDHFGMTGYHGWVRVNLLSPDAREVFLP